MKHGPTRWLSMKKGVLRVLEQLPNIKEYFLKWLPKNQKPVTSSERHVRIAEILRRPDTNCYLAFMTQDFEKFLRIYQFEEPMIHTLYQGISDLCRSLMRKFIASKPLYSGKGEDKKAIENKDLFKIDVMGKSSCKKLPLIDVGTHTKVLFSTDNSLIPDNVQVKFRSKALKLFQIATKYLFDHMPQCSHNTTCPIPSPSYKDGCCIN